MTDCSPTDNLTAKFSSTENDVGEEVTCKCRCVAVELFLHHDAFKRTLPLVFFDEHCIDHMRTWRASRREYINMFNQSRQKWRYVLPMWLLSSRKYRKNQKNMLATCAHQATVVCLALFRNAPSLVLSCCACETDSYSILPRVRFSGTSNINLDSWMT